MKLTYKVSLWIGFLVALVVMLIGIASVLVANRIVRGIAKKSLENQAGIASILVKDAIINAELKILYEVANQPGLGAMDWAERKAVLGPVIDRLGYLDFGLVDRAGNVRYIKDDSSSNLADRDYIQKALKGEKAVSDVLISRVTGKAVLMFAVPLGGAGEAFIGRKDGAVLGDLTAKIGFGDTGYLFLVNRSGVFVCHPNSDLVYNQFNPLEAAETDVSLRTLADFISGVLSGGNFFAEYDYQGRTRIGAALPISETGWFLIVTIEKAEFFSEIKELILYTALIGVGALILSAIMVMILASMLIIKPLGLVMMETDALARAQFDIDIPEGSKDEIGDLLRALGVIRGTLRKTIADINNKQLGQLNISRNLHDSIKKSSDGLGVINNNIETVKEKTGVQIGSVNKTAESVEAIIRHIGSLENAVEVQGDSITRSSKSIEQMVSGIDSVRDVVNRAGVTTEELSRNSETGQKMLSSLTDELAHIAEQSAFLEQANTALFNIASQTNILAMNAAIEAAHAGEAGRGFAVVSGEVRKLAELSNKESASISSGIKSMRDGIDRIRKMSSETVDTMGNMFAKIENMESLFVTVNTAVEAQASNGQDILDALNSLRTTTEQVHGSSDKIQKESSVIRGSVEDLQSISKNVNDSILDVRNASNTITSSLDIARKIAEAHYLEPPDDAKMPD
jgi:methyl-accepting chemotaxis protein